MLIQAGRQTGATGGHGERTVSHRGEVSSSLQERLLLQPPGIPAEAKLERYELNLQPPATKGEAPLIVWL